MTCCDDGPIRGPLLARLDVCRECPRVHELEYGALACPLIPSPFGRRCARATMARLLDPAARCPDDPPRWK